MSLKDGNQKMSKSDPSEYSRISLLDESDEIIKKIKKAKTADNVMPEKIEEIINLSCSVLKKKVLIKEDKTAAPSVRNISSKKIKSLTNWKPKFDLLRGLNSLNKYFSERK